MAFDYGKACKSAADAQGVTAIHEELTRRGIASEVWQTGGFTMVCVVPLSRNASGEVVRYIGCTEEGCGVIVETEEGIVDDEWTELCSTSGTDHATAATTIADAVSAWLKSNK